MYYLHGYENYLKSVLTTSKVTAPQDTHGRFSAAGLPWLEHFRVQCCTYVKSLLVGLGNKVHCYIATRPEVESLEFRVLWFLKNVLPSRDEPDISLSIVNSKARLHLLYTCALRA